MFVYYYDTMDYAYSNFALHSFGYQKRYTMK